MNFVAAPLSQEYLETMTWAVRQALALTDPFLPVADMVEYGLDRLAPGFVFHVGFAEDMGSRHGFVDPVSKTLELREDVYHGLIENRGRDRFTACHEIGHAVLHRRTLNRVREGAVVKAYCNPEWQANSFASALLMPRHMVRVVGSLREMMSEFGVSEDAARTRVKVLKLHLPLE